MFRREMRSKRGSLPPKEGDLTCMYYVEVPRILITGSNFQFNHPVEFLEIFQFFCISTFHTLVAICANIHTFNLVLT